MSKAITEAMVEAARDAFKAKCGIKIYLPGEGTLDDFEMERYDALKDALSAALAAAQARPAVVKPLVSTQRLDDLICAGVPTSDETHDMAVELLNHRRSIPALVSQPVAIKPLEWREWTGSQRGWQAECAIGQYQVCWLGEYECWQCSRPHKAGNMRGDNFSRHEKRAEAQDAAQSDYESRVLSALSTQAVDETERWRPIETAPIDGTDILVCVTYNLYDDECETMQWVDWQVPAIVWPVFRDRIDIPFPPTHWMPLPAAPSASIEGETKP